MYDVGTHFDFKTGRITLPGEPVFQAAEPERQYEAGTVFSFLKMKAGLIVTSITEPSIALRVSVV